MKSGTRDGAGPPPGDEVAAHAGHGRSPAVSGPAAASPWDAGR